MLLVVVQIKANTLFLSGFFYHRNQNEYAFQVSGLIISSEVSLTVGRGVSHLSGKTNADVETINFQDSYLPLIPKSFFKLFNNLKDFECHKCSIKNFHGQLESAGKLLEFEVSANEITELLDNSFEGANQLATIDLDANLIRKIDRFAFKDLKNLHTLSLAHNIIEILFPDLFIDLSSLTNLRMFGNRITSLDGSLLATCLNLVRIDFSQNFIRRIGPSFFENQTEIERFSFLNNRCASFEFDDSFKKNKSGLLLMIMPCYDIGNNSVSSNRSELVRNSLGREANHGRKRRFAEYVIFIALVYLIIHV